MTWVLLENVLFVVAVGCESVAVIIIAGSAMYSITHYFFVFGGHNIRFTTDQIRIELGRGIVLGLEFLLAADIVRTMITPDYYSIGLLSILVIIRTVLTYFLNIELDSLSDQERNKLDIIKSIEVTQCSLLYLNERYNNISVIYIGGLRPNARRTNDATKITRNTINKIFAKSALCPATPEYPKKPATNAKIKNITAQSNIIAILCG